MSAKPFTVEINRQCAVFTEFTTVPGAEYLQPVQSFRIPLANWRELVANGGPQVGETVYCNWTSAQLQAHNVEVHPEPHPDR